MLYGERYVQMDEFKKWVNRWELGTKEKEIIEEKYKAQSENIIELINNQIISIKEFSNSLSKKDDWRSVQNLCNFEIYDLFFKTSDHSIQVGNFYECFLLPCDIKTKKQIISGFDYKNIGRINITKDGNLIGSIGVKSDIIWAAFYNDFIYQDEDGCPSHVLDHEEYLSLQFWDSYSMAEAGIQDHIDNLLYICSVELGLNFKVVSIPKEAKNSGIEGIYQFEYKSHNLDRIPMMYFQNGFQTQDNRLSYLSYYQVLEYYFVRAQNKNLIQNLIEDGTSDIKEISDYNLRKALRKYNNSTREIESLKLVVTQILDINELKTWINSDATKIKNYTTNTLDEESIVINLEKPNNKIISKLANRIYYFRCSIAHAKGDVEEYTVVPNFNDDILSQEIDLMKYISIKALDAYSI